MTEPELRKTVLETLSDIAPEADLGSVPPDEDLREQLGHRLDGFPQHVIALHEKRGVDLPTPTAFRRELAD